MDKNPDPFVLGQKASTETNQFLQLNHFSKIECLYFFAWTMLHRQMCIAFSPLALALAFWLVVLAHRPFIVFSWSCACWCLALACALVWWWSCSLVWSLASCFWTLNISTSISCKWLASSFSMASWSSGRESAGRNHQFYHTIRPSDGFYFTRIPLVMHTLPVKDILLQSLIFDDFISIIVMVNIK